MPFKSVSKCELIIRRLLIMWRTFTNRSKEKKNKNGINQYYCSQIYLWCYVKFFFPINFSMEWNLKFQTVIKVLRIVQPSQCQIEMLVCKYSILLFHIARQLTDLTLRDCCGMCIQIYDKKKLYSIKHEKTGNSHFL